MGDFWGRYLSRRDALDSLYKNYFVHNVFGHPLGQLFKIIFGDSAWRFFHDGTLPRG